MGEVSMMQSPDICHMHYTSVLEASAVVRQLGRGTSWPRLTCTKLTEWCQYMQMTTTYILGIRWLSGVFVDTALPFGLHFAPKIFSAFADALAWVLFAKGVVWQLHYLDDCRSAQEGIGRRASNLSLPKTSTSKTSIPKTD